MIDIKEIVAKSNPLQFALFDRPKDEVEDLARTVLDRDDHSCVVCGTEESLTIDTVEEFDPLSDTLTPDDLTVVCDDHINDATPSDIRSDGFDEDFFSEDESFSEESHEVEKVEEDDEDKDDWFDEEESQPSTEAVLEENIDDDDPFTIVEESEDSSDSDETDDVEVSWLDDEGLDDFDSLDDQEPDQEIEQDSVEEDVDDADVKTDSQGFEDEPWFNRFALSGSLTARSWVSISALYIILSIFAVREIVEYNELMAPVSVLAFGVGYAIFWSYAKVTYYDFQDVKRPRIITTCVFIGLLLSVMLPVGYFFILLNGEQTVDPITGVVGQLLIILLINSLMKHDSDRIKDKAIVHKAKQFEGSVENNIRKVTEDYTLRDVVPFDPIKWRVSIVFATYISLLSFTYVDETIQNEIVLFSTTIFTALPLIVLVFYFVKRYSLYISLSK